MVDDTKPLPPPEAPAKPPMVPLGYYARIAASEARRFRRKLTRENFNNFLKTMAWVAPLTLLIWIYAEREGIDKMDNVPIQLNVEQPPGMVLTVQNPRESMFECELSGPRSKLDQVRGMLRREISVKLDVAANTTEQFRVIPLIENIPEFKNEGIVVTSCTPDTITLSADTRVHGKLPVRLKLPAGISNVTATFNPSEIDYSAPGKVIADLPENQRFIDAQLTDSSMLHVAGQYRDQPVTVVAPVDGIQLSTTSILATINVAEQDVTKTITNVAVQMLVPGGPTANDSITDKFSVHFDNNLASVTLSGPAEVISKLNTQNVIGVLALGPGDMKPSGEKIVQIFMYPASPLPPNVKITSPDSGLTVKYTTTDRNGQ